ncbi:hypothetical protein HDU98_004127 [Podochytrium sp. JEL0797]|nr:hypothetical protein HDU98_004127 [Podochytrium sp. JEL0797]
MRDGKPLKLRVANFNLLNFHEAGVPFYNYHAGLSPEQVEAKIEWTASQLVRMNSSIVAFQEVFSLVPLREAARRAGYDMSSTRIISPSCDGKGPAVGLLSTFPIIEHQVFTDFPPEAQIDLSGDSGNPPLLLPITKFSRPVLRVVVEAGGHKFAIFVIHLKSKRPVITVRELSKDLKMNAIGTAISLTIRAAEAAALRCILLDELAGDQEGLRELADASVKTVPQIAYQAPGLKKSESKGVTNLEGKVSEMKIGVEKLSPIKAAETQGRSRSPSRQRPTTIDSTKQYPCIVMGDLNDITHAVSTEEILWRTLLYSAHDVQARTSDKDVNYTYIHNGRYEILDNILISNSLVRNNSSHIGYVQWVQCFNDHLIDQALAEDDDEEDSPLTKPRAPRAKPSLSPVQTAKQVVANDTSAPDAPSSPFRPAKLRGRDVTKSDHGQVVAMLKIFPKQMDAASYERNVAAPPPNPAEYFSRRRLPAKPVRYGVDGMADVTDNEEVNLEVPERDRKHKGHHKPSVEDWKDEEGDLDADEVANVFYAHSSDAAGRALKTAKK